MNENIIERAFNARENEEEAREYRKERKTTVYTYRQLAQMVYDKSHKKGQIKMAKEILALIPHDHPLHFAIKKRIKKLEEE